MASEVIDIKFIDSSQNIYQTTHLLEDIKSNNHMEFHNANVLLIETPSLDNKYFKTQNHELEKFGIMAETYQVLFVVASAKEEHQHGYHTTVETAKKLFGEHLHFRVRLLNARGIVLHESVQPVTASGLKRWLEQ